MTSVVRKESGWLSEIGPPVETGFIITYTGKTFNLTSPLPNDIDIVDIAHHLSCLNRFTGAAREPYTIAQHSVLVSTLCRKHQFIGLMHDSHEAYVNDISNPFKRMPQMSGYREVEDVLQEAVFKKFKIHGTVPSEVKYADRLACIWEGVSFMPENPLCFWTQNKESVFGYPTLCVWSQSTAEKEFLDRFYDLTK